MEYKCVFENQELLEVYRALCFRSSISSLLRNAAAESELSQKSCDIAVNKAGYHTAWVGMTDEDPEKMVTPLCFSGKGGDYLSQIKISWADNVLGHGPTGSSIRESRPVICRDFATDPKVVPWREEALKRGIHSSIALPMIVNDQVMGSFTLYRGETGIFSDEEVSLLVEVAKDMAYGIANLRLKKQMEQALKELENANHLKTRFLAIAAHELRTPITTLSLLVQMNEAKLKNGIPVNATTFSQILKQTNHLTDLVEDLLNTSKLERGEMTLRLSHTDLNSLVSGCLANCKNQHPKRTFSFVCTEEPLIVKADALRIEQVVVNLLDNANKYSPVHTPIEVRVEKKPKVARVSVSDQGAGISKEQQPKLFSQFFRVSSEETLNHPGLGLGLFICRNIIELHGGKISVESELNQGSSFYFDLPLE